MGEPRWGIAPYLIVVDVVTTANYYRDTLGFEYHRLWNEPPSFCVVHRNSVAIMLAQLESRVAPRPNRTVDPEGGAWDAYIWVNDADAIYAELKTKGVKIAREDIHCTNGFRYSQPADARGPALGFRLVLA